MSKQELKQKGFTIIEVVLVLAIAALIFLMVFIALPALQSSQRDTARKNDVSIVAAAVNSWASNNRDKGMAAMTKAALVPYVQNVSENTTINKTEQKLTISTASLRTGGVASSTVGDGSVWVVPHATCGDMGVNAGDGVAATWTTKAGTARQYVVITRLEAAKGSAYCLQG